MNKDVKDKKYHSLYLYGMVLNACIGSFYTGYQISLLNSFQLYLINDLFHWTATQSTFYTGLLGAAIPLGAIISTIASDMLLNVFGRRGTFIIVDVVSWVGIGLSCVANYPLMAAGWFVNGACTGLTVMLSARYVNEISPPALKNTNGALVNGGINLGVFAAYCMSFGLPYPFDNPTPTQFWRFMVAFPGILTTLQLILFLAIYKDETPKFYILHGKEEAAMTLNKTYADEELAITHLHDLTEQYVNDAASNNLTFTHLFEKKYRRRTATGVAMVLFFQFTGTYVLFLYMNTIFLGYSLSSGIVPTQPQYYEALVISLVLASVLVLSTVPAAFWMEWTGRRTNLITGFSIMTVCYTLFEIFQTGIVAQVSIVIVMAVMSMTVGSLLFVYVPEVIPASALSYGYLLFWTTAVLLNFTFPILVSYTSLRIAFIIFLATSVGGLFWSIFGVIETKGLTSLQIVKAYSPKEFHQDLHDEHELIKTQTFYRQKSLHHQPTRIFDSPYLANKHEIGTPVQSPGSIEAEIDDREALLSPTA
jgi:MFS family permease